MTVVAYSICRRCAAVFPDGRGCPGCDDDAVAATAIAQATAHAAEPARRSVSRPGRGRWAGVAVAVASLTLALGLGLGWWFASSRAAHAAEATLTDSVAADR